MNERPVGLKLGSLTLDVPFFQASLSGYSDHSMRRAGPAVRPARSRCTDVILAKSVAHRRSWPKPAFAPATDEHPVGAQILGKTPATMARAARDWWLSAMT